MRLKVKVLVIQCVQLFVTLWTVARQAPVSVGFSRQEYWSGLPFSSPTPAFIDFKYLFIFAWLLMTIHF